MTIDVLDTLSHARTALDDPLALGGEEIGVDGPRAYAIDKIDLVMDALGSNALEDAETPAEKETYLRRYAGLVWNIGTILCDRRGDDPRIWDFMYESIDEVYEVVGRRLIDGYEDTIFGGETTS
jgi:hypothetical protein